MNHAAADPVSHACNIAGRARALLSSAPAMARPLVRHVLGATAAALVAWLAFACSANDGRPCYPGDWRGCSCDDGTKGYARCDAAGQAYGACDCTGSYPFLPDAGAPTDAAGADVVDSGLLPFLASCMNDSDCATMLCFHYNAKGPRCSHACQSDSDCELPSPGCSNMKVCKAP